jgi:general secretion pathway protein A
MVLDHFNLREQPFGVTPDPRYLYPTVTHREALACLLYGIESGAGFVTLTATPGMGKTTLLFEVLRRIHETTRPVFVFQTISTPVELVRAVLADLGMKEMQDTLPELQEQLNDVLMALHKEGKRLVVVIDEAQNLNEGVLEAVRMLSNFETPSHKLMQIVLSGQPQLADTLALPAMLQLRQRISMFGVLKPLSAQDTKAYVEHRLRVSGGDATEPIFTNGALRMIAQYSEGIPRNINNICFNALSLGCALRSKKITPEMISEVLGDLGLVDGVPTEAETEAWPHIDRRLSKGAAEPKQSRSKARVVVRMALGCAVALVFGWLAVLDYRALRADGAVEAETRVPCPLVSPPAFGASQAEASMHGSPTRFLQVLQAKTLRNICAEQLHSCGLETWKEMVRLNPSIRDLDYVEAGAWVAIPALPETRWVAQ